MSIVECQPLSRAELRRHHIKTVARRLFVEHGFHATGIALIAKEAGVGVQQLYRDFQAKEDIVAAIVEADCKQFADLTTLNTALSENDRAGIVHWLTSANGRKDDDSDRLFLEIASEACRNPRINVIFNEIRMMMSDNISRAFAGLHASETVRDEHRILAEAFMIISVGSVFTHALHGSNVRTASERLVNCLIDEDVCRKFSDTVEMVG